MNSGIVIDATDEVYRGSTAQLQEDCGTWIRPDESLGGTCFSKLALQNSYDDESLGWQSEGRRGCKSFSLQFRQDLRLWLAKSLDDDGQAAAEDDVIFSKEKMMRIAESQGIASCFMAQDVWALREALELHDLSWLRVKDAGEIRDEVPGEAVVWRVQKHWTHDGHYATSDTVEQTLWLDKHEKLADGSDKWTASEKTYALSEDMKEWACCSAEAASIVRPAKKRLQKPWMTALWTADMPQMFTFTSRLAALWSSKHLLLSYVSNTPLDVKYVTADMVLKEDCEKAKQRDMWHAPGFEVSLRKQDALLPGGEAPLL